MAIVVSHLNKAFQKKPVLTEVQLRLEDGSRTCLMAPSGAGKTTLLRILMGLETADSGTIDGLQGKRIGAVFQEDRLCEMRTPIQNVALVCAAQCDTVQIAAALAELLPPNCLHQPVKELSGGMRRRVALCRAVLSPSDVLLLDEPFTGLDFAAREAACRFLLARQNGRTMLAVTHQKEDAALLQAQWITL